LTLDEVHNYLLNFSDGDKNELLDKNPNSSVLLEKIYEKTFNDYQMNENLLSFEDLKSDLKHQKILNNNKSSNLFSCKTPGCNAIY